MKMCQNPSNIASEMYKLKIVTFDHGQLEEFLQLMKNFKRVVDGTGTATVAGNINYPLTILHWESLQDFDKLASQNLGTNNTHLKLIQ